MCGGGGGGGEGGGSGLKATESETPPWNETGKRRFHVIGVSTLERHGS